MMMFRFACSCSRLPLYNSRSIAMLSARFFSEQQQVIKTEEHPQVKLKRRMVELGMCSRKKAERHIWEGTVSVQGKPAFTAMFVDSDETDIQLHNLDPKESRFQQRRRDQAAALANGTVNENYEIRVTKRMSELDMCSRREAEKFLLDGKVFVRGEPAHVGMKVQASETDIVIVGRDIDVCGAIVLNKPVGYVSGTPEQYQLPAVRLLTKENALGKVDELINQDNETLTGFAPAGRLDKDSSGLLIFCRSGVIAKKLVSSMGVIPKEYVATVQPAHQPTTKERNQGLTRLPRPTLDLDILKNGGSHLLGDVRPLKEVRAKWLEPGETLQLRLKEGRKRQVRRMCRELLGFHVVSLERITVGPVKLKDLPSGKWRPLTKTEVNEIIKRN